MGHPTDPCTGSSCDDTDGEASTPCTLCDRVATAQGFNTGNLWVEGGDGNGNGGICLLDTMTIDQVIYVLQRDPAARADLRLVTTDEELLMLAEKVPALTPEPEADKLQTEVNRNADSIPFYSIFRGQPPFAQ